MFLGDMETPTNQMARPATDQWYLASGF